MSYSHAFSSIQPESPSAVITSLRTATQRSGRREHSWPFQIQLHLCRQALAGPLVRASVSALIHVWLNQASGLHCDAEPPRWPYHHITHLPPTGVSLPWGGSTLMPSLTHCHSVQRPTYHRPQPPTSEWHCTQLGINC